MTFNFPTTSSSYPKSLMILHFPQLDMHLHMNILIRRLYQFLGFPANWYGKAIPIRDEVFHIVPEFSGVCIKQAISSLVNLLLIRNFIHHNSHLLDKYHI